MTDVNRLEEDLKDEFGSAEAEDFDASEVYPDDDHVEVSDEEADEQDSSPFEADDDEYAGAEGLDFTDPNER